MATVGPDAIQADEWLATLKAFWGAEALRKCIEERLVVQEAHRLGVAASGADIEGQLARVKAEYPNTGAFTAMLQQRGVSENALRREIKTQLLLDRIVAKQAKITDAAVESYYQAHLPEYVKPTRIELFGITAPDMRTAAQAYERLAHDEFPVVAKEMSADEHAAEGGFWGWMTKQDLQPETLQVAAFALEVGKYTEPLEVGDKGYVLWVKSKEPGSAVTLVEAAPGIREKLLAELGLSREAVLRGILRRAKIDVAGSGYAFLQAEYDRAKEMRIFVDGQLLTLPAPPYTVPATKRTLAPASALVKALGAEAKWWEETKTLQVIKGDLQLLMALDSPLAKVIRGTDGEDATLEQAPQMREGVLFVPPKWVVEQLGGSILFSPEDYALKIRSVKPSTP
jgi:foldase protein PrsA